MKLGKEVCQFIKIYRRIQNIEKLLMKLRKGIMTITQQMQRIKQKLHGRLLVMRLVKQQLVIRTLN
jgi:hypothetical protein